LAIAVVINSVALFGTRRAEIDATLT